MTAQRDWHSEPEPADELKRPKALHDDAGPFRLTIATLGGLIILGMVLYGLNRPHDQNEINASRPESRTTAASTQQPGQTTGAATQDAKKPANAPAKAQ